MSSIALYAKAAPTEPMSFDSQLRNGVENGPDRPDAYSKRSTKIRIGSEHGNGAGQERDHFSRHSFKAGAMERGRVSTTAKTGRRQRGTSKVHSGNRCS